jgi:hypothetical protein
MISADRARELSRELLDATGWIDGYQVNRDAEEFVVGSIQRCRRLVRACLALDADADDHSLEQEILLRALLEFVITLSWMVDKPDERLLQLQFDEAVRVEKSIWELDRLGTQPASEREVVAVATAKAKIEWAWRELGKPDRIPKEAPGLADRAGKEGREIYALVYRHQCRVAAHPGTAAIRPVIIGLGDDGRAISDRVLAPPSVNPIGVAFALLWHAVAIASQKTTGLPETPRIKEMGREIGVELEE